MTPAEPGQLKVFMPGAFAALPDRIATGFAQAHPGAHLWFHAFVPSGDLANEIISGAECDVYVSANPHFMDRVVEAGRARSVSALASNRLTIITRPDLPFEPGSLEDLLQGETRLVVPQPETDPCGRYVRDLLEDLGLASRFDQRRSAGEAMFSHGSGDLPGFLFDGRADAGIFYYSETIALGGRVRVIELPRELDRRERIRFVIAPVLNDAALHPLAEPFVAWMTGAGQALLIESGFLPAG